MSGQGSDILIVRYLDGSAGPKEVAALNEVLKTDAETRSFLRAAAFQALTLADLARSRAPQETRRAEALRHWNVRALAGAAAMLLICALWLVWLLRTEPPLLRVVRASGAVSWSGERGLAATDLEPGAAVGPGTVTLEGARSSAELSFEDGSTLTLAGDSEVSFRGEKGKQLFLGRGSITVDVRPQAAERPMVLRTPTAEVEVVGTCFSLSALPGQTMVTVGTGQVRLRRLVDGASTEVPQGQMAVATLNAAAPLESRAIPPLVSRWRATFDQPPAARWQGEWIPADSTGPGRLKNVLDVSYRRRDGTIVPAHVVSLRDPSAITTIRPESILRVKWRVRTPSVGVVLLLSVQHPDGKFAGNFQTDLKPEAFPPDADGWRLFSGPVSSLEIRYPEGVRLPASGRVTLVFAACYSSQAGLEIAEVAFE